MKRLAVLAAVLVVAVACAKDDAATTTDSAAAAAPPAMAPAPADTGMKMDTTKMMDSAKKTP